MEHHDYSIVVSVQNAGFPDDQTLSKFPQISIAWNISKSYHVIEQTTTTSSTTKRITQTSFDIIESLPSAGNISDMLHAINVPFPLNRLHWKSHHCPVKQTTTDRPLNNVDDMISNIHRAVNEMLVSGMRKKLNVIVTVDKQIRIPRRQHQATVASAELQDMVNDFRSMVSRSGLQRQARDQAPTRADVLTRRLALTYWNQIRARAAAAGLTMDSHIDDNVNSYGGDYRREMNQMLMELGTIMELLSDDGRKPPVKAASNAWIEGLEKFMKTDGVDYGSNSENCVVCMEKMVNGVIEVSCLPCSHMFHAKCIVQWLQLGHTCPVCRFELPTD